jgi:choline dehydrogenase
MQAITRHHSMKTRFIAAAVWASLALAAPAPASYEERDLLDPLASLSGVLTSGLSFDYIVVGAGIGGLTIAKRLAEDTSVTVAVIEAGTLYEVVDPILSQAPAADTAFVGTDESLPTVDWGFFTNPDPASNNIKRSYARGKCLGGRYALQEVKSGAVLIVAVPRGTS